MQYHKNNSLSKQNLICGWPLEINHWLGPRIIITFIRIFIFLIVLISIILVELEDNPSDEHSKHDTDVVVIHSGIRYVELYNENGQEKHQLDQRKHHVYACA